MIDLTYEKIDTSILRAAVARDDAGAIIVFEGTTRNHFEGRPVLELSYEAYAEMAMSEMHALKRRLETEITTTIAMIIVWALSVLEK